MQPDVSSCAYPEPATRWSERSLRWQRGVKRLLDLTVAGFGLLALAPLGIIIGLIIKATSPGPVLYRWPVVGYLGRPLKAYKFRTMVVGADDMKRALLRFNESSGPVFKMKHDPRVTPVGRALRKFSLDELPQLWNILKGEMSLVGPRPVLVSEWGQFSPWQRQKLSVRPGAVCLWHVRGQPRDFHHWIATDIEYIQTWSLWLDVKILMGAAWYMISGKNV
jgi:lipopolysaccharide/colanic/teichoic acid biosynthesis glycosyltransferase